MVKVGVLSPGAGTPIKIRAKKFAQKKTRRKKIRRQKNRLDNQRKICYTDNRATSADAS